MISMRNIMIHKYDDVDLVIVWETVKNDMPQLVDSLEKILGTWWENACEQDSFQC